MINGKTAIVTGITGQDGFYLAKHLLDLGYRVVGIQRRTSTPSDSRLSTLKGTPNLVLVDGDVTDQTSLQECIRTFKPQEFYHLAAQSHVGLSWQYPNTTCQITGMGTLNCLEAIRREKPDCRFYFAGSSEQFGNSVSKIQGNLSETSPMFPESPYAAAKVFGYNLTQVYRRSYDMFATCGILFNHESPLRGEHFVTRKITKALGRIKAGTQQKIQLGNIYACRDWGFAGDYVKAMHLMLQQDEPDDYVIATGETYSVQHFLNLACENFGLNPDEVLEINSDFKRPKDVNVLIGDASKAENKLGWKREKSFKQLVDLMCVYDLHKQSEDPYKRAMADQFLY